VSQSLKQISIHDEEEDKMEGNTDQMMTRKIINLDNTSPNILPNIYFQSQKTGTSGTLSSKFVENAYEENRVREI